MKPPDHLRPSSATMNMTPMIDVVFLLIIFFLVSSNLIQQDVSMELQLPAAETAMTTPETEAKKITVNIPAPGQLLLGAQPIDSESLREYFLQRRADWGADTGLRIRTNRDIPYGEVEPILVLAAECGVWNVSFAVVERR
jgi:biopolymer transport protein ExbD